MSVVLKFKLLSALVSHASTNVYTFLVELSVDSIASYTYINPVSACIHISTRPKTDDSLVRRNVFRHGSHAIVQIFSPRDKGINIILCRVKVRLVKK